MSKLDELITIISIQDRMAFLKFRQDYIEKNGSDRFKRLLKQAEKELLTSENIESEEYE